VESGKRVGEREQEGVKIMAKNHFVSQLIIRRFSDAITTFDSINKQLVKDRKTHRVFYKDNLYTDEIEKQMAIELESPFANLIDKKILGKQTISITRDELYLIKRFLLLDSIRTYDADGFYKIFVGFKSAVTTYAKLSNTIDDFDIMLLPSLIDKKEDKQTLYMQTMKMFIECKSLSNILFHKYVTREAYCWAKVVLDMYIAFWDSADNQEFILTDNGITTEYEPSHTIFKGLDPSKFSYLFYKMQEASDDVQTTQYAMFLAKHALMYENFSVFSLSSTRSIVMINPFFKLYDGRVMPILNSKKMLQLEKPDIWPTCMETKEAFKIPETQYKLDNNAGYSSDDIFIYTPSKLSTFDTVRINTLALQQKHNCFGFNDIDKVVDSLCVANMQNVVEKEDIYGNHWLKNLENFVEHLLGDEYNYIFKQYKDKKWKTAVNPFEWLDKWFVLYVFGSLLYILSTVLAGFLKIQFQSQCAN
jgi:hypothetical protein